jgi:lon-related putative ATP-dependent protease
MEERMQHRELKTEELYNRCDPAQFSFKTTADLEKLKTFIGQPRAVESLRFGIDIERPGYNVFALGPAGTGKHSLIGRLLEERASSQKVPNDCCYVNNFDEAHKPHIIFLPAGKGKELSHDMEKLMEEARNALKAALENEEYQNSVQAIAQEFEDRQREAVDDLREKSHERNLTLLKSPSGLVFAPVRDGEVVPPEEFKQLPEAERKELEKHMEDLQREAQRVFQKMPTWEREMREKMKSLQEEITGYAIGPLMDELRNKYGDIEGVADYLHDVEKDIIKNVRSILPQKEGGLQQMQMQQGAFSQVMGSPELRRYRVNVLVDHSESEGAPVVFEDNPTCQNLTGRIEHMPHMGTLLTDFNMIRPGALHRARGGYLVLDALKVLTQPFAWEALKRSLRSQEIKIESLGEMYGVLSTVTLEPQPVPLDVKVILLGAPFTYYMLQHHDPEFSELFKVAADFDIQMKRTEENQTGYCRLLASVAYKEGLRPLDPGGVARVIEHSARIVGDGERLSVHMQSVTDLLCEADYWAGQNGNGMVTGADVQRAIDARIYRLDKIRERMQDEIKRGTILIDTQGEKVGQVNGLSVIQSGEFAFGRPSRITARVRLGKGEVVDIEREVEMGGPIHSKGVLILAGFLGARYAMDQPLSLSASLVFEQSYSGVEGDSASSAELYALLSAIGQVPIKQSLAVTGSVNQHGQVQPIGGVNEKIEGFFDTCRQRGLSGKQGVLIPASNLKHLMLRQDVINAVKEGKFHIYPVESVDQGMEILTGAVAGEPDKEGNYPAESINGKVYFRLAEMAEKQRRFSASASIGQGAAS